MTEPRASSSVRRYTTSDGATFLAAAAVIIAVVVGGFARTYFFRPLFPDQEPLTSLVWAHGLLMTGWIALFVTQIILVARGHIEWHRRLGRLGAVLLLVIAIVAIPMVLIAARLGGDHMPGPAQPALASVLGFLITFLGLAAAALLLRRRPDFHKRLMLVATVVAMEAGTSRLPIEYLDSFFRIHATNDLILLAIVAYDTLKHRRLHPAFAYGTVIVISMQAATEWIAATPTWLHIAQHIIGMI